MTTLKLEYESVSSVEGETHLIVIAWDVATNWPVTTGRLAAMATWLGDHGFNYVTGLNGVWSNEIGPDPRR
jgi:hypothetical protein